MESHLEARLWNDIFIFAQEELGIPQRLDQGHRADRDACSPPSRWTRSCASCASTRPGLNIGRWDYIFSCIKKFRSNRELLPRRPRAGDDDRALHARLRAAAGEDLPPPRRAGDGRHGGADPDQERPGGERGGAGEGARGQAARGDRRLRRHLGRAPGPGADREGGLRQAHAAARTSTARSART